ncbi:MAG: hypothetical protein AAGI23_19590 [Bacteroidota bacterium]
MVHYHFVKDSEIELMTRLLYECILIPDSVNMDLEFSTPQVIFTAQVVNLGALSKENAKRIKFHEVKKVNGKKATVAVSIKTNPKSNLFILSDYQLTKEDSRWKVNVPSTFKFYEKLLQAQWQKSGGSAQAFIKKYISDNEQYREVHFRARIFAD